MPSWTVPGLVAVVTERAASPIGVAIVVLPVFLRREPDRRRGPRMGKRVPETLGVARQLTFLENWSPVAGR